MNRIHFVQQCVDREIEKLHNSELKNLLTSIPMEFFNWQLY